MKPAIREGEAIVKHLRIDNPAETTPLAPRERVPYWDNAKFILIFFVVLGHFLFSRNDLALPEMIALGIYSFHMPAFAFVAGNFSTSDRGRSKEKIVPLLVAYVTFNGLFVLYSYVVHSDLFFTIPYYSMWYLLALVFWRITVPVVAKVPGSLLWTAIAAVGIGFWPDADNYFGVSRIVAFYPFFLAGYLAHGADVGQRLINMKALPKVLGALACWAITIVGFYFANRYLHFVEGQVTFEPFDRLMDVVPRVALLVLACTGTLAVLLSAPRARIPLFTAVGANTLSIYLVHRYFVLLFQKFYATSVSETLFLIASFAGSVVLVIVLGIGPIPRLVSAYLDSVTSLVLRDSKQRGASGILFRAACILLVVAVAVVPVLNMRRGDDVPQKSYEIYPRLSAEQETKAKDGLTILFAGDLTLLEDQVRAGYTGDGYDYAPVFEYTKPYIEAADLAIGVLEGPCAGADAGYSSGNFDDTKPFWLNFPDEFAKAVKDAGFDLVTTATNHILDKGEEGALRTIEVLDKLGLGHTGTYRDAAEKEANHVRIIEKDGVKLAVLSYTYGVNNDLEDHPDELFVTGEYASLTSTIVDPNSSSFGAVRANVEADFAKAKELGADLIVVLPHWGTQFTNVPDDFQKTWRGIFLELGADIILGAHSHDVQPIVMEEVDGRQTLTCYCPGNYCDLYRDFDGDCSALVEVNIDPSTKTVVGGSIIPLWTERQLSGNYRAVPVGDIVANDTLRAQMTNYDLLRVEEVQQLATSVMLGTKLDLQMAQTRHPFTAEGYERASVPQLQLSDDERAGTLAKALTGATNVCFVGDWATEGTRNGGFGWYEPFESLVKGKVTRVADVATTSMTLQNQVDELIKTQADLFVVAVGANDVRYRDESDAAQTADAYTAELAKLVTAVKTQLPQARFVFVAPWTSVSGDMGTTLMLDEKRALNAEYSAALKSWCSAEGHGFVDPNPAIERVIDFYPSTAYLVDSTQPNCTRGLELYARSALAA